MEVKCLAQGHNIQNSQFCWDLNSRPFDLQSGTLQTEKSDLLVTVGFTFLTILGPYIMTFIAYHTVVWANSEPMLPSPAFCIEKEQKRARSSYNKEHENEE